MTLNAPFKKLASAADVEAVGLAYRFERASSPQAPLLVLLHGRAGTYDVPWIFRRTAPEQIHVVSFQAPRSDPMGGWSWWSDHSERYSNTNEGRENAEFFLDSLDKFLAYEELEPQHCSALGFSQGAALLSCSIQLYPKLFDKVALLAGLFIPLDEALAEASRSAVNKSAILWLHGKDDDVIPAQLAEEGVSKLRNLGFSVEFLLEDGVSHKIGIQGMRRLKEWFL